MIICNLPALATDASAPANHNAAKTTERTDSLVLSSLQVPWISAFAQGLAYPFCFRQLELPVIALDRAVNYDSSSLDRCVNNQAR